MSCADAAAGTVTASFSGASGSNANTAAYSDGTPSGLVSRGGEGHYQLVVTNAELIGASRNEDIQVALATQPVVGTVYTLSSNKQPGRDRHLYDRRHRHGHSDQAVMWAPNVAPSARKW